MHELRTPILLTFDFFARIDLGGRSLDRTGEEVGVQRQLHDLRGLAGSHDWEIVEEIVDNDISASKGLHRPGYERVWDLVTGGKLDHVLVTT